MQFPTEAEIQAKARELGLFDDGDALTRSARAAVVDALVAAHRPVSEPPPNQAADLVSRTIVPTGDGRLMVEVWHIKE